MLIGLHVKNLALIEQADVEFGNGLNILTGETGAGKSIIIGSVALALGAKASKDMIRRGEDYAYIELTFSVDDEKKREELKSMDVYPDDDGLLIISKKITPTRSISRINDETVTTARLKAVTGKLLDIPGKFHLIQIAGDRTAEIGQDTFCIGETGCDPAQPFIVGGDIFYLVAGPADHIAVKNLVCGLKTFHDLLAVGIFAEL